MNFVYNKNNSKFNRKNDNRVLTSSCCLVGNLNSCSLRIIDTFLIVAQLNEIRKVKLSRIVCDNSDHIESAQIYVMVLPDPQVWVHRFSITNPYKQSGEIIINVQLFKHNLIDMIGTLECLARAPFCLESIWDCGETLTARLTITYVIDLANWLTNLISPLTQDAWQFYTRRSNSIDIVVTIVTRARTQIRDDYFFKFLLRTWNFSCQVVILVDLIYYFLQRHHFRFWGLIILTVL